MIPVYLYFLLTLLLTILFPSLNLQTFSPFLVYTFYKTSRVSALGWSLAASLIPALLSPHTSFGLFPFVFILTTYLLYEKKQHFFIDSLSTFPLLTFIFSFISTLFLALLTQIPLSLPWVASDLIFLPLLDGVFAFLCYTLPHWWLGPKRRRGEEYFLT